MTEIFGEFGTRSFGVKGSFVLMTKKNSQGSNHDEGEEFGKMGEVTEIGPRKE